MTAHSLDLTKEKISRPLYCSDFDQDAGFPGCCDSCHDDSGDGYHELIERYERYDGTTLTHVLCCRVARWIDAENAKW